MTETIDYMIYRGDMNALHDWLNEKIYDCPYYVYEGFLCKKGIGFLKTLKDGHIFEIKEDDSLWVVEVVNEELHVIYEPKMDVDLIEDDEV